MILKYFRFSYKFQQYIEYINISNSTEQISAASIFTSIEHRRDLRVMRMEFFVPLQRKNTEIKRTNFDTHN